MSTESTAKNQGVATFYIAIEAGSDIARELRRFLTAVQYANVSYGEDQYKDYLKERGHKFKSEMEFARVAFDVKESNIERYAVVKEDKDIIENYAKKYGMDYCLIKRPDDLENLIKRKFVDKEEMTGQEEKIIRAFTYRDGNKETLMNPENPSMPLINDAAYMLTIASVDLDRWELICREMESRTHKPSFKDRMNTAKHMAKAYNENLKKRARERQKERQRSDRT